MARKCSKCGLPGHNVRTCGRPEKPRQRYPRPKPTEEQKAKARAVAITRDDKGLFLPGTKGNPGGMSKTHKELRKYIQGKIESTEAHAVVDRLIEIVIAGEPRDSVSAGKLLLEYGYGRPRLQIEHTGADGGPIEISRAREDIARTLSGIASRIEASSDPGIPN